MGKAIVTTACLLVAGFVEAREAVVFVEAHPDHMMSAAARTAAFARGLCFVVDNTRCK